MNGEIVNIPTREELNRVKDELMRLPQYEPVTRHYFANGMYLRAVTRDAGVFVMGRIHKQEHFCILVEGRMRIFDGVRSHDMKAGDILVSVHGTERATLSLERSTLVTVHRPPDGVRWKSESDLDDIEHELLEPDEASLFTIRNELKNPALGMMKEIAP